MRRVTKNSSWQEWLDRHFDWWLGRLCGRWYWG